MYINRTAEEIFMLANFAASIQNKIFDNCIKGSIKEVAEQFSTSEKQLHFWKNRLIREGLKIFSSLKPGRKKKEFSSLKECEKLLVYETVNHLLVDEKKYEGKNRKFSVEVKEKILKERGRLKEEYSLPYENFSKLLGLDSGNIRLWSRKVKNEGKEGLKDHSRAPKRRPKKLPQELIDKIVGYGSWWKLSHRGKIKLTEFSASFRWKYWKLLARYGRTNLSDKTIARYLKEADLYWIKEEKPKGKRGNFRYYFSGAQLLIDTTLIEFGKVKAKLISVMDALSRDIFHQEAFLSEKAEKVEKCIRGSLKEARRLGLNVLSLLSDHGRAYKARRVWEYLKGEGISRVFSPPYRPQGKAPLERYFRTVKEGLSNRWEVFILLIKGLSIWVKKRIVLVCLNLSYTGVLEEYPHLLFAAVNYFRNWGHAVTSSGIDYSKIRRHTVWSRKKVKKELMKLQKAEELSYNEFERKHPELFHAAQYHFGSWQNALSAIGIDYRNVKKPGEWSKEKIVEEIKSLKDKGVDLSWRAMFRHGYGAVVSMGTFYYGSWHKAIESAGLNYSLIKKMPGPKKKYGIIVSEKEYINA